MVTAVKSIIMADEQLGVGKPHSVKELTAVASPIYAASHPDAKTPDATIGACIYAKCVELGITERLENGTYLVHPERYTRTRTSFEEQAELIEEQEFEEYELEKDIYPILENNGYKIIADSRGNGAFMNPDALRVNGGIESIEVKNTLTSRNYAQAIAEATTNGAWANTTVLIYVDGPDAEIKTLATAMGVGVRKVVGKNIIDVVAPRRKDIDKNVVKLYTKNQDIANLLVDVFVQ